VGAVAVLADRSFGISSHHFHTMHRMLVLIVEFPLRRTGQISRIMTATAIHILYFFVWDSNNINMAVYTPMFGVNRMADHSGVYKQTDLASGFFGAE
jgi:hypothetical protein